METNDNCEYGNGLNIDKIETLKVHGSDRSLDRLSKGLPWRVGFNKGYPSSPHGARRGLLDSCTQPLLFSLYPHAIFSSLF